ncbi:MAG: replication-associated recombination protein A [Flavobacteriaceae bacterium]|nr:replication-associated recombination protein A [Flavobacteriales bacterium]MDP4665245.1 replication-associated recombination protein A [Flavobacteriaceae bacterium]
MNSKQPLAERMRPKTFDDYVGQEHLTGKDAILRKVIERGNIPSMILWGPPGVGKTTLATIISNTLNRPFHTLSAINSGVKDVREVISRVGKAGMFGGNAVLFIDEIHRFSKSQQDSLLGAVEKGIITLIGATTENPSFEVIPALLSRSQVYVLNAFTKEHMRRLIAQVMERDEYFKSKKIEVLEEEALFRLSGGDGRKLLNVFELVVESAEAEHIQITNDMVNEAVQSNLTAYDKGGELHYDIISAYIKSIRGSDPNAALYYLARMIEGGEDPKFIARRLLISASEDIGNANPTALVMANNAFTAVERIGWPEGRIVLAQATVYLASSAKSNASYAAIGMAQSVVKETGNLSVPLHLRNAPTKLMKDLGYGKEYNYSHANAGNFAVQEYLPEELKGTKFYEPGDNAREKNLRQFLKEKWGSKYGY